MKFSEIKSILSSKTVGIAGAGGLGSNCAAALVRSGLGKLIIADYDFVDEGNLNRQFYFIDQIGMPKVDALRQNLLRINPHLDLETRNIRLNPQNIAEVFSDVDVLVEAFDQAEQKEMLMETALSIWQGRPLIVGLGMAGYGNSESLIVKKYDELYICGDETEEISLDNPPLAPRVGIVSNMQANVAIEILIITHDTRRHEEPKSNEQRN